PALTFFNSSMLCSAWVLAHAYVVVPRVITYLFAFVITGPIGSLADACGQWAAQMSYVLRPSNTSFGLATVPINRMTAAPDVWSEYFTAHPPRSKPPLWSSVWPPGACMTPSIETKAVAIILLMLHSI